MIDPDKYYMVSGRDMLALQATMKRLYEERRLSGDDMRDMGNRMFLILADPTEVGE